MSFATTQPAMRVPTADAEVSTPTMARFAVHVVSHQTHSGQAAAAR